MHHNLFNALLSISHTKGMQTVVCEDASKTALTYRDLIRASRILGWKIAGATPHESNIGILLPNANGAAITFFALQSANRVPTMLNAMAGAEIITQCATIAAVRTILTSRAFIKLAELAPLVQALENHFKIIYLEDLKKQVTLFDKLRVVLTQSSSDAKASDPACVLFTSGSEGMPKGVALSHRNFLSNIEQIRTRLVFNDDDVIFNALPMFHSFGLTAGTLLPILSGVKTFLYPTPLHYQVIPELIQSSKATIFFSTNTFLNGYARKAAKEQLAGLRYIVAGGEALRPETRELYREKFDQDILEGYGVTETAPVLAVNYPGHNRPGTIGQGFDDIEYRLAPVDGIEEGGRLQVRGPNIMLGYYHPDRSGTIVPPLDGWHDTGDIASIDKENYIRILGRARRFAKIGGEMICLTKIEHLASAISPDYQHAAIAIDDAKKGEQVILLTTDPEMSRDAIAAQARKQDYPELFIPRQIKQVDAIPLLPTGKIDYMKIKKLED